MRSLRIVKWDLASLVGTIMMLLSGFIVDDGSHLCNRGGASSCVPFVIGVTMRLASEPVLIVAAAGHSVHPRCSGRRDFSLWLLIALIPSGGHHEYVYVKPPDKQAGFRFLSGGGVVLSYSDDGEDWTGTGEAH
ncbi:hypothetical protein AVEN_264926-1 [Araneus ventricosus]|uniref:Uncharacterized protein n=1 Tax=Araneus ventricosus TaxID=182803 RepID=A0A4Y2H019_ARAVE|nr:hypothetical protein AVEN_264926-1 [Araneus ventricosus]